MAQGNQLVRNTFFGILIVNAIGMISGIMCVMIDAMVTGQFLGMEAVAATGLITPIVLLSNLLGTLLGPGLNVVCSRLIGMAKPERCNQAFSLIVLTDLISVGAVSVLLFLTAPALSTALGGRAGSPQILHMMSDYLRGFSFSLVPMCLTMGMSGLMMLDNDPKRGILAMLATLAGDVAFDLANVLVFHGGMLGMAIATSLSNILGLLVLLTHFRKRERILHFTPQGLNLNDLKEVVLCGLPGVISMGSQAARGFAFNLLLLSIAGSGAVAALSVANSTFTLVFSLALAMVVTTTTLCSLFYGEEDRNALVAALSVSMRTVVVCFAVVAALLLLFARPIAGLFLNASAAGELDQAAQMIRFMSIQFLLVSLSYSLCGGYQGIRSLKLNYLIAVIREAVFPLLICLVLGRLFGIRGFEIGLVVAGGLTLLLCFLIPWVRNGKFSAAPEDLLLLPPEFGSRPEELFEAEMKTMEDVMAVSEQVMQFCREKGAPERTAMLTSLFVEEMAGNTVQHGFRRGRGGYINLRLVYSKKSRVIRLRDNGMPFDPVDWLRRNRPEDPTKTTGISMIVGLAKDVRYIPAMGLNNLMLVL